MSTTGVRVQIEVDDNRPTLTVADIRPGERICYTVDGGVRSDPAMMTDHNVGGTLRLAACDDGETLIIDESLEAQWLDENDNPQEVGVSPWVTWQQVEPGRLYEVKEPDDPDDLGANLWAIKRDHARSSVFGELIGHCVWTVADWAMWRFRKLPAGATLTITQPDDTDEEADQ